MTRHGLERAITRLDTPLLFPALGIGVLNLDNFRNRVWAPAVLACGIRTPARICDLGSTFASNALAAGFNRVWATVGPHRRSSSLRIAAARM